MMNARKRMPGCYKIGLLNYEKNARLTSIREIRRVNLGHH